MRSALKIVFFAYFLALVACGPKFGNLGREGSTPPDAELLAFFSGPDERGFYPLSDGIAPLEIATAAKSVYQLVGLSSKFEDYTMYLGMSEYYKIALRNSAISPTDQIIMLKQFEACERNVSINDFLQPRCRVYYPGARGSGFLAGDGRTLWSARHLTKMIEADSSRSAGEGMPMFIFDQNDQLVLDPLRETIQEVRPDRNLNQFEKIAFPFISDQPIVFPIVDYIFFALPRAVGQPIPIAKVSPKLGQRVYALGFPTCTGCEMPNISKPEDIRDLADRWPKPNSPGKQMRMSYGTIASRRYVEKLLSYPVTPYESELDPRFLSTTVDVVKGNSGGPLLDKSGSVLGIVIMSAGSQLGDRKRRIGIAVRPHPFL